MSIVRHLENFRLWMRTFRVKTVVVSTMFGLSIAILGSVPYYDLDSIFGGRLDLVFEITAALFVPGLLFSALFSGVLRGNLHDASLAFAVIVNTLLYGLGMLFLLRRVRKVGGNR